MNHTQWFEPTIAGGLRQQRLQNVISVHLGYGIWGTLAVGIFGKLAGWQQLWRQLIGIAAIAAFCLHSSFLILILLKRKSGIRVSEREEVEGLDTHEHGSTAYSIQYE